MLVPISWLNQYVKINHIESKKFYDEMIMSGSNIENVHHYGDGIKKVVVGKVLKVEKHPDADKLFVITVDIGSESLVIVTGADNVKKDDYVPVVQSGGWLPGGIKIKKGKLRGIESNGMLCSAQELGFGENVVPSDIKEGILILDQAYPMGMDILEALDLKEDVVEFEITPNRPDCLSILGIAREAAAVFSDTLIYPPKEIKRNTDNINEYISVEIKKPDLCKRFAARVVKDITIKHSPWWLQKRLMTCGVRPINNIVDITNYVMLEYGQPLHAYDLRYISGNKIIVDTASENQKFTTLDGAERKLDSNMLMINDEKEAVGLAGIMGGLNSEIKNDTVSILIEAANFDADNVRASSKKLGLRTEASSRFEKGIDPNLALDAVNRACKLIEELGAGTIISGAIDIYPKIEEPRSIKVRSDRINALLNTNLSVNELADLYRRLEMKVDLGKDALYVQPPTVRLDLKEEVDMLEEAARIYGYDNLDATVPKGYNQGGNSSKLDLQNIIKEVLIAAGLNEIQTYSFTSPKGVDMIKLPKTSIKRNWIRLINPLGEENSIMRTTLAPNMMDTLLINYNRNINKAAAFEIGRVFLPSDTELPNESISLVLGAYGQENDFYMLKGIVETLFDKIGIKGAEYEPEANHSTYHPGRCANILYKNEFLGIIGEIHPDVAENYDICPRVYLCELDFDSMFLNAQTDRIYFSLPKYPAIDRDIAIVVEEKVYVREIENIILQNGGKILENVELFDIYRGKQVKEGYKSVAYSLTYRNAKKTLTDEEVNKVHSRIIKVLKEELGAELRE